MGGQNGRKIEIFGIFFNMLFGCPTITDFCVIFDKIDVEKRDDFSMFSVICFVLFLALETLKIVLPPGRELNFHKIAFFALDEKRC